MTRLPAHAAVLSPSTYAQLISSPSITRPAPHTHTGARAQMRRAVLSAWEKAEREAKRPDLEGKLLAQCQEVGLPEPETHRRFHPVRKWEFDLAWPAYMVAAEVEGGVYPIRQKDGSMHVGRHLSFYGYDGDVEKYNAAQALGWIVNRVTKAMIKDGRAIRDIQQALAARGWVTPAIP